MAEDFSGFSNQQVKNAALIKDSMAEINNLTKLYNKELGRAEEIIADVNTEYRGIKASADQVKNIQEQASKSSAATAKAIEQQQKQLNIVARLNARIDRLFESAKKSTGDTRENLLAQARVLGTARDNAQSLADSFEQLADDSARLTNSNYVFSTLAELAKDVPGLRTLAGPFEAAAEAARNTTLSNAKTAEIRKKLASLTDKELETGKGLTYERVRSLGLEAEIGDVAGSHAAKRLSALKAQSKTSSSMMAGLNAGAKALGPALSKAFAPLAIAQAIVSAFKFIVGSIFEGEKRTVSLARNLMMSEDNARAVRDRFTEMSKSADKMYLTTERLISAQQNLTDQLGISTQFSDDMLDAAVALEHRFGMSGQEAAKMAGIMKGMGGSATDNLQTLSEQVNELRLAGETSMNFKQVMGEISGLSAEARARFGGSTRELLKSVTAARRMGMSLEEAHNMGKGLNDVQEAFVAQSNLAAVGLGDLNVQRALELRALGKTKEATAEILKQFRKIPVEQRKMPHIQEMFNKAYGANVEQLIEAEQKAKERRKQEELLRQNMEAFKKEQQEILANDQLSNEEKKKKLQLLAKEKGIAGETFKTMTGVATAQEEFSEAVAKAKDQFVNFVDTGALDSLTGLVKRFVSHLQAGGSIFGFMMGRDAGEDQRLKNEAGKSVVSGSFDVGGITTETQVGRMLELLRRKDALNNETLAEVVKDMQVDKALVNKVLQERQMEGSQYRNLNSKVYDGTLKVNDFTLKSHPKDTLVMAGGTRFGEETNKLLRELITAVREGGDVVMDGNKVGYTLSMAGSKF